MRDLWQDLRFGVRILLRNPGFTAVAVITLALGIAASTTVFSWIDGLIWHPLPGTSDPDRLVMLESVTPNGYFLTSWSDFRDYRDNVKQLAGLAACFMTQFNVGAGDRARMVWGELVSGNFFDVLEAKFTLGHGFLKEDVSDQPGGRPVVAISDRLWQSRFARDPNVVGRTLRVNRHELTIVGVTAPEFLGSMGGVVSDMWVPVGLAPQIGLQNEGIFPVRSTRCFNAVARLKSGVALAQAQHELQAVARRLAALYPQTNENVGAVIVPLWQVHTGGSQPLLLQPMRILMGACVVVLLIVCANVGNLLLARAVSRQTEMSIRLALGAGPRRLARQLFTETLLLTGAAAVVGVLLALWAAPAIHYLGPTTNLPIGGAIAPLNRNAIVFTILVCVVTALLAGMAPVLYTLRSGLSGMLREGGRGGTSGAQSHRLRSLLVAAEVALATVALIGAGLFAQSYRNINAIYPGFDSSNVVLARFYLGSIGYSLERAKEFCRNLEERLQSSAGVTGVAYADTVPLGLEDDPWEDIRPEGYESGRLQRNVGRSLISPRYFDVMRIPILQGREFDRRDEVENRPVMIVNEAFAKRFFGGANPVGRRVNAYGRWLTVVGMAKNIKYRQRKEAAPPYFYLPFQQYFSIGLRAGFFVRTSGDMDAGLATIRREVAAIDPDAAAFYSMPLAIFSSASTFMARTGAVLLGMLGLLSLALAAIGLYGVMSYTVNQRRQEFGIRIALGAEPNQVMAAVLRGGLRMTLGGLVAGLLAALAVSRLLRGMLVDVSPADPATFAGAALFLGAIALLASWIPARRATRVEPADSLHCE
jgi:predicted permease